MRFIAILAAAIALAALPRAGHAISENFRCTYDNKEINAARTTNLAVSGVNVSADRTEYLLWESKVAKDKKKPFLKLARLFVSGPNKQNLIVLWHGATGEGATEEGYQERVLMEAEEAGKLLATLEAAVGLEPRQEVLFCSEGGLAVNLALNTPAVFAFYNQHSSKFTAIEVPWGEDYNALIAEFRRLAKGP